MAPTGRRPVFGAGTWRSCSRGLGLTRNRPIRWRSPRSRSSRSTRSAQPHSWCAGELSRPPRTALMSPFVAVVGHVELVEFLVVDHLPEAGEILPAAEAFVRAAGGGGVAAGVLAELGADVELFCALGDDRIGRMARAQLEERNVRVHAALRERPTRRAMTLLERAGERTIVTIGERLAPTATDPLPWDRLARAAAVYFTAGDLGALHRARQAPLLVATPRAGEMLASGPRLDALVWSAADARARAGPRATAGGDRRRSRRQVVERRGGAGAERGRPLFRFLRRVRGRCVGESAGRRRRRAPPGGRIRSRAHADPSCGCAHAGPSCGCAHANHSGSCAHENRSRS